MDWCCRTHITTRFEGELWTRAIIVPSSMPDDDVKDFLGIPEQLENVTELWQGISPLVKEKEDRKERRKYEGDAAERRKAAQRAYYERRKQR